jgi:hypothetical protein
MRQLENLSQRATFGPSDERLSGADGTRMVPRDRSSPRRILGTLEPSQKFAVQVKVHFGAIASELIEIKSGVKKGDKVIVTDMSRYNNSDRIRIE